MEQNSLTVAEVMATARRVHFVGIGGISMSSLAAITKRRGYLVTGSDKNRSLMTERLEKEGIPIAYRHDEAGASGADLLVYTAAIHPDNPELLGAISRGIPVFSRADYLGWLMSAYRERIGVAGTHGKSTVTSMISEIFLSARLNPTVVCGAELSDLGGAYCLGGEDFFIFEACEYCDSFLSFCPTSAVITNIEYDHADYFRDMAQLRTSFDRYTSLAPLSVLNLDDPESRALLSRRAASYPSGRTVTFSLQDPSADYRSERVEFCDGCASFSLIGRGRHLVDISLSVPGKHNLSNALAASALSHTLGVSPAAISDGLSDFHGARRRFEFMGKMPTGALLYNDYAHHPTEIQATLSAARSFGKRIVCVFQPHTYSRTAGLFEAFASSFGDADEVIFADIYAAREQNTYGVSSQLLRDAVGGQSLYLGDFDSIVSYLKGHTTSDDLVILTGAGDIVKIGSRLLA